MKNGKVFVENVDKGEMDESVKRGMKGEGKFVGGYFELVLVEGW